MNFSKLRHRIIFLSPTYMDVNSMHETVPRYSPYHPAKKISKYDVYLSYDKDNNAVLIYSDGKTYEGKRAIKEFSVAAFVTPMSGREYEESQKIRAETTYKISTRYFPGITPDMRILYNKKEFEIVSVLDLNERHEELQIVAAEKGKITNKSYEGESNGN